MTTRPKKQVGVTKAEDSLNRFKLSEIGSIGLPFFNGVSTDEIKRELNFPRSVRTFKEMSYHSTINGSLSFFDTIISKAVWEFKPPKDATEEEKDQCRIINEMMQDLEDGSWTDFIRDVMTISTILIVMNLMLLYLFSLVQVVIYLILVLMSVSLIFKNS